jgi:(1->4)-alpha-D-glucan 1-alpha-D-glucosylmutase
VKAYVTWRLLHLRREHRATFLDGSYDVLQTTGTRADHLVAFARDEIVVVVPRLVRRIVDRDVRRLHVSFEDERIRLPADLERPGRNYVDRFTGKTIEPAHDDAGAYVEAAALLSDFPISVLVPA